MLWGCKIFPSGSALNTGDGLCEMGEGAVGEEGPYLYRRGIQV
jgi:hypothetical protein